MMEELPFPRARNTDPVTSHQAARSVQRVRETQTYILKTLTQPLTDEEIAERYQANGFPLQSPSGLRTRRHELVDIGLVEACPTKRKTKSGRSTIVWRRTDEEIAESLARFFENE